MTFAKPHHKTRIACCQISLVPDEALNLAKCLNLIDQASSVKPDLVILPEMSNWSAGLVKSKSDALAHSVTVQGPFLSAIAKKAHQYGCFIAIGVIEQWDEETFITSVILSPDEKIVLKYQKQIPFGPQIAWASPGRTGNPVVQLPFARVGLYICADGLIPETTRVLALKGAQLLINTLHSGGADETYLHVPVRAYENQVWVASANKVGQRDLGALDRFSGGSQIVSPKGDVVARADALNDAFIWADVDFNDLEMLPATKGKLHELRRPECYGQLIKKPAYPFENHEFKGPASIGVAVLQPIGHGMEALHAALKACSQVVQSGGARLLVLPHLLMHDLKAQDFDPAQAAVLDVQALEAVKEAARKTSSWLVFSLIKVNAHLPAAYHLCTDLIDPTGAVFGSQIQIHVPAHLRTWVSGGSEFKVFQTPIGRIGLLGGTDAQVLESYRVLTYLGVQVVCVSGALEEDKEVDLGLRERVAENRIHIVFASRSDAPCARGSVIVQASAYPSEPHWRVRFPDVQTIEPAQTQLSASLDLWATNDKTVAPLGCDLLLSPRYDQYQRLIEP